MTDEPKDYEVGYGKPPKATQFPKGKSGNAKGRPKGSQNIVTRFWKLADRKIMIKDGNKQVEMSMIDVVLLQLLRQGGGGNLSAAKESLRIGLLDRPDDSGPTAILDVNTRQALMRSFIERYNTIETEQEQPQVKEKRPINVIPD